MERLVDSVIHQDFVLSIFPWDPKELYGGRRLVAINGTPHCKGKGGPSKEIDFWAECMDYIGTDGT
jgi:hypothetical protein